VLVLLQIKYDALRDDGGKMIPADD
jgi:hypothetical protein